MRTHVVTACLAFGAGVAAALLAAGPRTGRTDRASAPATAAPAPPSSAAASELARVRNDLAEREAEAARLREEIATLRREAPGGEPASGTPVPATASRDGPRFVTDAVEAALRAGNWSEAGAATARLMPLLSEGVDLAHGRRPMRAEFWGEITTNLGPIVTLALKLDEKGVEWSHPSVLANLVHATLRAAGQPMDEAQEGALDAVARRYIDEDARRRAGYGDAVPRLRRLLDSHTLQDRFFAEVEALLRAEQRTVLWPPGVKGVAGVDVFSGATVWDEKLKRLPHGDRADLRRRMGDRLASELELGEAADPVLRQVVAEWEAALPDAFALAEPTAAQKADVDMEPTERVRLAAARQLALFEALLARAPLGEGERNRLLEEVTLFIPQRQD